MTWPTGRERVTAHVAGQPDDGVQRCGRCGALLHAHRNGADPPWYPGQAVGMTDSRMVRMALKDGHGYPSCEEALAG